MIQEQRQTLPVTHYSPVHGTVTYSGTATLTATGFPFTIDYTNCYIVAIKVQNSGQTYTTYYNEDGCNISAVNDLITISNAGTPFSSSDLTYLVSISQLPLSENTDDNSINVKLTSQDQGSKVNQYVLLSATQNLTASFADFGYEFNIEGYNTLVTTSMLIANNSTGLQYRIIYKNDSGAVEEYIDHSVFANSNVNFCVPEIFQLPEGSTYHTFKIDLKNGYKYAKIQARVLVVGTTPGTLFPLLINLGY